MHRIRSSCGKSWPLLENSQPASRTRSGIPLNFVKNFSEASEELLDEMKEVLGEGKNGEIAADDVSYIEEISEDLVGNLGRIRQHSERANRIVQDMLMMGQRRQRCPISPPT